MMARPKLRREKHQDIIVSRCKCASVSVISIPVREKRYSLHPPSSRPSLSVVSHVGNLFKKRSVNIGYVKRQINIKLNLAH